MDKFKQLAFVIELFFDEQNSRTIIAREASTGKVIKVGNSLDEITRTLNLFINAVLTSDSPKLSAPHE